MEHQTFHIPFTLPNGSSGTARIILVPLTDGRTLVACMDDDDEDDAAVNMIVERLFREVCKAHRLKPDKVVWVEFTYGEIDAVDKAFGGWERVVWNGKPGESPEWHRMDREDWAELGTEPPLDPNKGFGRNP